MADAVSTIKEKLADVKSGPVVFSKSYCPYCKSAKSLLSEQGFKATILELDQIDNGAAIQDELADKTGQRTVPNIFMPDAFNADAYPALKGTQTKEFWGVQATHLGGNSELQAAKKETASFAQKVGAQA